MSEASMGDDVAGYLAAVDPDHRALFDRVHRLVLEVHPDADVVMAYRMPTFVAGTHRLHAGVWKHGLSIYGWEHGRDDGFAARHPQLDSGKGTLKLPLGEAAGITDAELSGFLTAALAPEAQRSSAREST